MLTVLKILPSFLILLHIDKFIHFYDHVRNTLCICIQVYLKIQASEEKYFIICSITEFIYLLYCIVCVLYYIIFDYLLQYFGF